MTAATWTRRLAGNLDDLSTSLDECRSFLAGNEVPADAQRDLIVALEEVGMNILRHGRVGDRVPAVDVSVVCHTGRVQAVVRDDGPAFDPLAVPEPSLVTPLANRRIGGLGILLIRRLMDEVGYRHEDGRNRLELIRRFEPTGAPPGAGTPP